MGGGHWEPPARARVQRALAPLSATQGSSYGGSLGEPVLSRRTGPGTFINWRFQL